MHTTNSQNVFTRVAPDCPTTAGEVPKDETTVAGLQYALLTQAPYTMTSDDLLFEVARRRAKEGEEPTREAFFVRPQACLRASPLTKRYGWGVHHDANGRIALYGRESDEYARIEASEELTITTAMRNRKA